MSPRNQDMPNLDPVELTWASRPQPLKKRGRDLSAIVRVSQRAGREGDEFMSPAQQKDVMRATAARNGDRITRWHDETDSISGGTVDRVGLKAALWEALNGVTDGVIVAKVNRFARTKRAGEALIYDLIEAGKSFIAAANNIDTAGGKLDRGTEVYLDFLLRQAQWEREDLMANWADVRHRHVANGVAVRACYGYVKDETTRRLVPNMRQALWVVRMFEWRAAGWSWGRITDELNRRNVAPPRPVSPKTPASVKWVPQHVNGIVRNRTYLGELRRGDAVNVAAHPAVVTLELWEAAHAVRVVGAQDTKDPAAFFVLRGIVRCASCGGRMVGAAHRSRKGTKTRYYRCRKRYPWGQCPKPAFVRADDLEAAMFEDFEHRTLRTKKTKVSSRRKDAGLAQAVAAVDQARAELREYTRATAAARAELGDEDFQDGMDERIEAVRMAVKLESEARSVAVGVDLPADIVKLWPDMDLSERAALLSRVYHCVAVRPTTKHKADEPAAGRMRVWVLGERDVPRDLPGRTIGARGGPKSVSEIRPITWK